MPDADWGAARRASEVYAKGIVPSGVVLSGAPVEATRAALAAKGIGVGRPYAVQRELPGADPAEIGYEIVPLREPGFPLAFIADGAPGAMRRPEWLAHPNSATGVRSVHLRVPSLREWSARAALAFGDAGSEIELGAASLVAHEEPRDPYLRAVSDLLPRDDRARLIAIELSVADVGAVRSRLERAGIATVERVSGRGVCGIGLEPAAGFGCGLMFACEPEGDAADPCV
jgi:hypothetical protein